MKARSIYADWFRPALLAWAMVSGIEARPRSFALGAGYWDHAFSAQADLYLTYYAVIPAWLIFVGVTMPVGKSDLRWIREGSHVSSLLRRARWFALNASTVAAVPLLAGLGTAIGLPWSASWMRSRVTYFPPVEGAAHAGLPPVTALVIQFVTMTLALTAVGMIVHLVHEVRSSITVDAVVLAGIFFLLLLTGRGSDFISTSGLFLAYQHDSVGGAFAAAVLDAAMAAATIGVGLAWDRRLLSTWHPPVGASIAALVIFLLLLTHALQASQSAFTLGDLVDRSFGGGNGDRIDVLSFATYAVVTATTGFLIGGGMAEAFRARMPLILIRRGRLSDAIAAPLRQLLMVNAVVAGTVVVMLGVLALLFGGTLTEPGLLRLCILFAATTLQGFLLSVIFFVARVIGRDGWMPVALFAALTLLAVPPINRAGLLPVGLNLTNALGNERLLIRLLLLALYSAVLPGLLLALSRPIPIARKIIERI